MFGMGKKKLSEQVVDYALVRLVPFWTPGKAAINEFLAAGAAPAVASALRASTANKKGNVAPKDTLADFATQLEDQLRGQLPAQADIAVLLNIAQPGAEDFLREHPEGDLVRDMVDADLEAYLALDGEPDPERD